MNESSHAKAVAATPAAAGPRIAFFLASLRGGGAEKVTVNLAKGFLRRGYQVDILLAKAEGPYLKQLPSGANVVDLKAGRVVKALPQLVSYLRRERPHALVAAVAHCNVIASLARQLARVPCKLVGVEHSTLSVARRNAKTLRTRFMSVFMSMTYSRIDRVVGVSVGVAKDLKETLKLPDHKVVVVSNPIVDDELLERAQEPVDHPWFSATAGEGEDIPILLSVGRLTQPKDFSTLLKAFALVRSQRPCRLVLLGEGPDRAALEALAQELGVAGDVWMPGFVDNPYAYMSRSALFILSSHREGLPTVLVEALACGTRILSTDCPSGPREIIKDRVNGRLVPVGDEKTMASAIFEELNAKKTAKKPADLNIDRFGLDYAVNKYLELLKG